MAAEFDPYQAWLGITKGPKPPNHYELLGLSLFTSEPPVIAEAANEQAAKIVAAAKGPYVPIGKKLLEELKAARALLLNAQNRRDYDARLRAELGLPAPHGSAPAMRAAAAPLGSPAASRPAKVAPQAAAPRPAAPAAAVPTAARQVAAPQAGVPRAAVPVGVAPVAARSMAAGSVGVMPGQAVPIQAAPMMATPVAKAAVPMTAVPMTAVPMTAAVPVGAAMPVGGAFYGQAVAPAPSPLDMTGDDDDISPRRRRRRKKSSSGGLGPLVLMVVILGAFGGVCYLYKDRLMAAIEGKPSQVLVVDNGHKPVEEPSDDMSQPSPKELASNDKKPKQPEFADMSNPNLRDIGKLPVKKFEDPNMDGMPAKETVRRPPIKIKSPTAPEAKPSTDAIALPSLQKPASDAEKAAVAKALADARTALGTRNFAKAKGYFDLATLEAASPESLAAVDRMLTYEDAVMKFWDAVRSGLKELQPIDEIEFMGRKAIVVNVDAESLSIRDEGKVQEFKLTNMPVYVARAVAEGWLSSEDPNSKVLVGALLAVDPKGSPDEAHKLWQEAAAQGADVAKLLIELDMQMAAAASK